MRDLRVSHLDQFESQHQAYTLAPCSMGATCPCRAGLRHRHGLYPSRPRTSPYFPPSGLYHSVDCALWPMNAQGRRDADVHREAQGATLYAAFRRLGPYSVPPQDDVVCHHAGQKTRKATSQRKGQRRTVGRRFRCARLPHLHVRMQLKDLSAPRAMRSGDPVALAGLLRGVLAGFPADQARHGLVRSPSAFVADLHLRVLRGS